MKKKYELGDFIFKISYKIKDILRTTYWRVFLGKLGKESYIKRNVLLLGNPQRI